jgi:hypothetical protein
MSLNVGDQECNSGKKYRQKGTLCGPNKGERGREREREGGKEEGREGEREWWMREREGRGDRE